MELFVAKELKLRFDPLNEKQQETSETVTKEITRLDTLQEKVSKMDSHYESLLRAILSKQGINLTEINEFNVLREYNRMLERENAVR